MTIRPAYASKAAPAPQGTGAVRLCRRATLAFAFAVFALPALFSSISYAGGGTEPLGNVLALCMDDSVSAEDFGAKVKALGWQATPKEDYPKLARWQAHKSVFHLATHAKLLEVFKSRSPKEQIEEIASRLETKIAKELDFAHENPDRGLFVEEFTFSSQTLGTIYLSSSETAFLRTCGVFVEQAQSDLAFFCPGNLIPARLSRPISFEDESPFFRTRTTTMNDNVSNPNPSLSCYLPHRQLIEYATGVSTEYSAFYMTTMLPDS